MSDDTSGLRYVEHEPGMWFLVAQHGDGLLLDARYSYSAIIDDSALIRLDDGERRAFAEGCSTTPSRPCGSCSSAASACTCRRSRRAARSRA